MQLVSHATIANSQSHRFHPVRCCCSTADATAGVACSFTSPLFLCTGLPRKAPISRNIWVQRAVILGFHCPHRSINRQRGSSLSDSLFLLGAHPWPRWSPRSAFFAHQVFRIEITALVVVLWSVRPCVVFESVRPVAESAPIMWMAHGACTILHSRP